VKASDGAYVHVIVDQPGRGLSRAFSYLPPKADPERIRLGSYVLVPFGSRRMPGFVVGFSDEAPPVQARRIMGLLVDEPLFSETEYRQAEWLAGEYHCSLGDALRCYLPPGSTRHVRRRAVLTTEADLAHVLAALGPRAAAQRAVVEALFAAGGETSLEALAAEIGADPAAALRALAEGGVAEVRRELGRASAATKIRRVASLTVPADTAEAAAELRSTTAPRQAEALRALAQAGGPVPTTALNAAAVAALQRDGLIAVRDEALRRAPREEGLGEEVAEAQEPTPEQAEALAAVAEAVEGGGGEVLVHGVTGSGKTEVYLQAIAHVRGLGRSAIVLVPEISLTPQLLGRFRARFGEELALLHSAIGVGERFDEWHRVRSGEARIVIGARSAVFAPAQDLGLLIIDEEHERAYKQDRPPRYDARTVAAERCRRQGAVLLLGSATPSVETYYRFRQGGARERIVELPRRIDDRPLPAVELVDMREETKAGRTGTFSARLTEALNDCLLAGNQAILFLNRRGFSTFVMCGDCGFSLRCPDCDVSLTYHHGSKRMLCHHCDHAEGVPDLCPSCEGLEIGFHGLGTERVADQVGRDFPDARVVRMDRDTTGTKGAHGGLLREFASGRANVLVGTQMIAKGLDLPNVTLVGVLNADVGLNRPDFRAAEHTFQLLAQVAGRAGRAGKPGQVIVQTYNPDNYAIRWAAEHDYVSFYHEELERRLQVRGSPYPPFGYLLAVHLSDEDEDVAATRASRLGHLLRELAAVEAPDVTIGGPAPAPLSKLRGRFRWLIVPRGPDRGRLHDLAVRALEALPKADQATVYLDADPVDMM
jgi:primosomal protein N' (replication factor Y)